MSRPAIPRPLRVMSPPAWRRVFLFALILALVGLLAPASVISAVKIWVASWLPFAGRIDQSDVLRHADKWVHLAIFLGLAFLGIRAWLLGGERRQLFLGLLLMALATESLQHFIPGRSASLGDLAADMTGLLLVVLALLAPRNARLLRRGGVL